MLEKKVRGERSEAVRGSRESTASASPCGHAPDASSTLLESEEVSSSLTCALLERVAGQLAREGAEAFERDLRRMVDEASETKRRADDPVDGLEGRKTAIREKARETKSEDTEMMKTYLGGAQNALDGSSS